MKIDSLDIFNRGFWLRTFSLARDIVVLGNGPLDPEAGARAAKAHVVVRFNNWNSRAEIGTAAVTLTGNRMDLLVAHLDCQPRFDAQTQAPRCLLLPIPAPFQIDRNPQYIESRYQKSAVAMVNPYVNRLLCRELAIDSEGWKQPVPTVGFTLLYHLTRLNVLLDVYVSGFDWHYDPAADTFQGHPTLAPKLLTHWNHAFIKEARWVQKHLLGDKRWTFGARPRAALERLRGIDHLAWEDVKLPEPQKVW